MIHIIHDILRSENHVYAKIAQRQMQDGGSVLEQLFIGKIGLQRGRGEKHQRSIAYGVLQAISNNGLQAVPIAKPFAEVLGLLVVHVVQADLAKLPISKQKPLDGRTGDDPGPGYTKGSFEGIWGNMLCCQRGGGGSARSADERCL